VPFGSRHSSDGIVNKLRIDDGETTVRFPARKDIFLSFETSIPAFFLMVGGGGVAART